MLDFSRHVQLVGLPKGKGQAIVSMEAVDVEQCLQLMLNILDKSTAVCLLIFRAIDLE
jgi:hypothetical protein